MKLFYALYYYINTINVWYCNILKLNFLLLYIATRLVLFFVFVFVLFCFCFCFCFVFVFVLNHYSTMLMIYIVIMISKRNVLVLHDTFGRVVKRDLVRINDLYASTR